jgi:hypothetical protein
VANTDDVRHIDVEAATIKYHNKHPGDLTPGSLRTYENRMNRLLGEFVKYNQNPANYKPRSRGLPRANGERPARSEAKRKSTATGTGAEVRSATSAEAVPAATEAPTSTPALAMSYPLRENFVAQVVLPRNLSTDEARKLCAFIRTLAVDFKPEN